MPREDKVCTRCVMDSTTAINIMESGVCSFCKRYEEVRAHSGYRPGESERELERTVRVMKERGRDREDALHPGPLGRGGQRRHAHLANKLGLRVLAVHVDSGWNSEMAVSNIEKMCQKLDVRLHTYVMDWPLTKVAAARLPAQRRGQPGRAAGPPVLRGHLPDGTQVSGQYILNEETSPPRGRTHPSACSRPIATPGTSRASTASTAGARA